MKPSKTSEQATASTIYGRTSSLHPTHASKSYEEGRAHIQRKRVQQEKSPRITSRVTSRVSAPPSGVPPGGKQAGGFITWSRFDRLRPKHKKTTSRFGSPFCLQLKWCPRPDLNRYGCPYAPQTYASASSATRALCKYDYTLDAKPVSIVRCIKFKYTGDTPQCVRGP